MNHAIDKYLTLDIVRVTEAAAIAASSWTGRGDSHEADQAAVDAMRKAMDALPVDGRIAIGEGERDEAPMLYIGEHVGSKAGMAMDIAVDPLEGTGLCAHGAPNALAVMAMTEQGNMLHAPDVYMEKIAIGGDWDRQIISLEASIEENLAALADAKACDISELTVMLLDRPRHASLIADIRNAGARVYLIPDGDVAAIIAATMPGTGVDMVIGTGGAPEGVLAAAALRCLGGQMQARLVFDSDEQKERAKEMGIEDPNRIYSSEDMAQGDVLFAATGVTHGWLLNGVNYTTPKQANTHSVVMRSKTKTIRYINTQHDLNVKNWIV